MCSLSITLIAASSSSALKILPSTVPALRISSRSRVPPRSTSIISKIARMLSRGWHSLDASAKSRLSSGVWAPPLIHQRLNCSNVIKPLPSLSMLRMAMSTSTAVIDLDGRSRPTNRATSSLSSAPLASSSAASNSSRIACCGDTTQAARCGPFGSAARARRGSSTASPGSDSLARASCCAAGDTPPSVPPLPIASVRCGWWWG